MKYKLTERQLSSPLGDEVVILDHEDGVYFGLDQVGALVWESLREQPRTTDELVSIVCTEYDVDDTTCRNDLEVLLSDLIKEKLVEITA